MRFTLFFGLFLLIGTAYGQEANAPDATAPSTTAAADTRKELPVAPDEPMVFSASYGTITALGTITPDTPDAFIQFIEKLPSKDVPTSVDFHSNGGDILAAMALGREIRKRGLSTSIPLTRDFYNTDAPDDAYGVCRDACLWAFLGGRDRFGKNIVLRTYRPPLEEDGTMTGKEDPARRQQLVDIAYINQYAHEMGFDMRMVYTDWQNPKPHVFTDKEMVDFHILFNPDAFGSFLLQPFAKGVVAMAKSNDGESLAMFYCNAKKQPIFQMKGLPLSTKDFYEIIIEDTKSVNFLGFNFPADKAKLIVKNGRVEFTLPLSNFDADKINLKETIFGKTDGQTVFTSDYPNFYDMLSLKATARIAMKNCL